MVPSENIFVPFHMCFDTNFDPRKKESLVSGKNMIEGIDEDTYYGMVIIDTTRTYLFLGNLKNLELDAADIGNSYIYGFTMDNI